jgi:uncharacterized protein (TIGR03437 family)
MTHLEPREDLMFPWRQRYSTPGPDTLGQRARARRAARPSLFELEARLVLSGPDPTITAAVPLRGYLGGGTSVTITGSNFALDATADAVTVGGVAARIMSASPTEIVILTPAGTGEQSIVVSVAGQPVTAPQAFTYADYTSPGSYSADGLGTGTPADPGSYVPTKGATLEMRAPAGYYVATAGATAPTEATPGYYVPIDGATAPTEATPGYYVPGSGASWPIPDPPHTWSFGAMSWYFYIPSL